LACHRFGQLDPSVSTPAFFPLKIEKLLAGRGTAAVSGASFEQKLRDDGGAAPAGAERRNWRRFQRFLEHPKPRASTLQAPSVPD
jgi:hypothetical protein